MEVSEDVGQKWCQVKMPKCPKYCFGHFRIFVKLLILRISGLDFWWQWRALFKGFDDIWKFWVGMFKKKENLAFLGSGACIHGCLVVCREWARQKSEQFCSDVFRKTANFQKFVCVGAEHTIFSLCGQKCQYYHSHSFRFVDPNLHENVFFVGAVGLVVWFLVFFWGHLTWP